MCRTPYVVRNKFTRESEAVPCGRCPDCVKSRISQWCFRLQQEDKVARSSQFITLTYDTKHVPISRKHGVMCFSKRDLQLFWKKLRKEHFGFCDVASRDSVPDGGGIKYYVVAEYGDKCGRPHYHALLFNASIDKIQPAWDLGEVHYGQVSGASIGYTLKYMMKHAPRIKKSDAGAMAEFAMMSKGIGQSYLCGDNVAWHLSDWKNRAYLNIGDGKKCAMPRYYRERLYTEYERKAIAMEHKAKVVSEELKKEMENPLYFVEKFARDRAAFWKMYRQEKLNRSL